MEKVAKRQSDRIEIDRKATRTLSNSATADGKVGLILRQP